jgi:hypothetical protein
MPAALAVAALNNALVTRDVASTIVHSDSAEVCVKPRNGGFSCIGVVG